MIFSHIIPIQITVSLDFAMRIRERRKQVIIGYRIQTTGLIIFKTFVCVI